MSEAVAVLDAEGRVQVCNPALSQLTGYSLEEWRSGSLELLFRAPEDKAQIAEVLAQAFGEGEAEGEAEGERRDGSALWLHYRLVRIMNGNSASGIEGPALGGPRPVTSARETGGRGPSLLAIARDITSDVERRLAQGLSQTLLEEACLREQALTNANRKLAALNELAATVNQSLDLTAVLGAALECSLDVAGANIGWVRLMSLSNPGELELAAHRGLPAEYAARHRTVPVSESMGGKAVLTGKPFVFYSLPPDDRLTPYLRQQKIRCVAHIPLRNREHAIGVLVLGSARFQKFSEEQVRFLTLLGHQVGLAIGNARLYEQVKHRAEIDPLTGLYNRQRFSELLDARVAAIRQLDLSCLGSWETAARSGRPVPPPSPCVLMIDIDDFKRINDVYGHACGDQALREVAQLLRLTTRTTDIVGRFGGDEFVVALCDERSIATGGDAAVHAVVERLRSRFQQASQSGEFCVPLAVSIGIAHADASSEECLQRADEAMYHEKRRRKRASPVSCQ
jgi:diguanylate cyclase (GGDEF)-like protein/PAS domain S-box-containing protein